MPNTFKSNVLKIVSSIPKGKYLTYLQVAKKSGHPKAYRAVGNIMAQNKDRSVPCHRVVRSDGKLGGYNRGGEKVKRAILKKEGAV